MEYTYQAYKNLLYTLKNNGYTPIRFCDALQQTENPAIIRHDVDLDLQQAERIALIEKEIGIRSTYFVLLSSEYYNLLSRDNIKSVQRILRFDHEIGLHFDISAYNKDISIEEIGEKLGKEVSVLEEVIGATVKSFSWHIPRKDLLNVHLGFTDEMGLLNAYDPVFYSGYKYVSDSMMRWREPVKEYIERKEYGKLQILTHPIWYREVQDMTAEQLLDQSKKKRIKIENLYLNTIKPGYYSPQNE